MSVKPIVFRGLVALWMLVLAGPVLADNARLPYHLLYNAQKAQAELNRTHTNLLVVLTIQSTLPDVKTSDLAVTIEAKAGPIPVQVQPAGEFAIPLRDDLRDEDPWIVINQPKGTMKLNWQVGVIPGPITRSIHYARLMKPVRESEDIQEQMRRFFPGSPRRLVTGLKLSFSPSPQRPYLVLHAKSGDRKLEADEQGEIILPLVADLLEEDPEMTLSTEPGTVEIISHPAQE